MAKHTSGKNTTPKKNAKYKNSHTPITHCVACKRTPPSTTFSYGYKVSPKNIQNYNEYFSETTLDYGSLCDNCYHIWHYHTRCGKYPVCVRCNLSVPSVRFYENHQVDKTNIRLLENFFGKKLEMGELCNSCWKLVSTNQSVLSKYWKLKHIVTDKELEIYDVVGSDDEVDDPVRILRRRLKQKDAKISALITQLESCNREIRRLNTMLHMVTRKRKSEILKSNSLKKCKVEK